MSKTGLNMGSIKHQNRALILRHIYSVGPTSRKEIASATGLTAASVTQIVSRLISENVVTELSSEKEPAHVVGRRKIPVDIKADAEYVYSVNIEPDTTYMALCDLKGVPAKDRTGKNLVRTMNTDNSIPPEEYLGRIAEECRALSELAPANCRKLLSAVSVGITGIVDTEEGISVRAYGIWTEPVDIRKILGEKFDLPVIVENNVNAFAIAALMFGVGRTHDNFFVIKWGPGVGSAIILDGMLYKAPDGRAAEFGHLIIDRNGKQCACGRRGCLETMVSYRALNELMPFEPDNFEERFMQASDDVKKQIERAINAFARCLVNTAAIIAPKHIVLFGRMFRSASLMEKLINACKNYDPAYDEERIMRTTVADSEGFIGPAAVYVQNRLNAI